MNKRAFSIVELIIVLAVIGILAAILIPVMSNMIENANEKSALSDAKNTLTSFEAHYQGEETKARDSLFIVNKAEKYYLYGYFEKERLMLSSKNNPHKAESIDSLISSLTASGDIVSVEEINDVTSLFEVPMSTKVFSGYRLMSLEGELSLNRKLLAIALGASEDLVATVTPWEKANLMPLQWESDNPSIAKVENGTVTGMSQGETTVTAYFGSTNATCSVIVDDYIEFYGDIAALKVLIEDESDPVLFVKIMQDIEAFDVSFLFPIVIPEGKVIRLNTDIGDIVYQYTTAEQYLYAMFINNGGDFYLETTKLRDSIGYCGVIDANAGGNSCVIENRNGGKITLLGGSITNSTHSTGTAKYGIINTNGIVESNSPHTFLSSTGGVTDNSTSICVYNGKDGKLALKAGDLLGKHAAIINYGEISEILSGTFQGDTCIINYGLIKEISGGTLHAIENGFSIENIGKDSEIRLISGGKFGAEYDIYAYTPEHLILLHENSKLGKITGGTFLGVTAIEYENISDVRGIVHGGIFLQEVPAELIATGKSCKFNEELGLFEVS